MDMSGTFEWYVVLHIAVHLKSHLSLPQGTARCAQYVCAFILFLTLGFAV